LTYDGATNWAPVWTPDGRFVVFLSDRGPFFGAYMKAADGSGEATLIRRSDREIVTADVSRDGMLSYTEGGESSDRSIWTLRLGDLSAAEFLATAAVESMPMFSPDGRWIAYISNDGGRTEVYVRPYPAREGALTKVSDGGGTAPVWSRDGSTLYYRDESMGRQTSGWLMAVPVRIGTTFSKGRSVPLFQFSGRFRISGQLPAYDVSPKGDRFIMTTEPENARPAPARMNFVLNWQEELTRLVPTN
jgi:hypothetical protein